MAAVPPPPITTFAALYADAAQDPYAGDYAAVMQQFAIPVGGAGWTPATVHTMAINVGTRHANAYVGMFPHPGEAAGRTRLLHAPMLFPATMGNPTAFDGHSYAFLDDIAGGTTTTVEFPNTVFNMVGIGAFRVHNNIATATAAWGADANMAIVPLLANGADVQNVRVPNLMYVPPAYIYLFIGRRLTPRQLVTEVLTVVETNGHEGDMAPFVQWCLAAGTQVDATLNSGATLMDDDVVIPVPTPEFMVWRQNTLHTLLPTLVGTGTSATAAATVRIAGLMGDLLTESRETRRDTRDARTLAAAPKTVTEYFKTYLTDKIMMLCDVAIEGNLPDMWHAIASNGGKRDREVIDEHLRAIASGLGLSELSPVVTPGLAKKIVSMRFSGSNLDDLAEGIHPFCIVIMDHTTGAGERTYNEAQTAAFDYDDIMRGSGADLSDIKILKNSTKVLIPETYALSRAMLQSFRILLIAVLGETHAQVLSYNRFLSGYINRENFFMGRLQRADPLYGPARLLRYIQLVIRAWFEEKWTAPRAAAASVPEPDFQAPLTKMGLGDMSWLPELPSRYMAIDAPQLSKEQVSPPAEGKKKAEQVRNPTMNPRFEDFRTMISKTKFNDAIKKVGDPPQVKRYGKMQPMCASYHLRGACYTNCARKADHGPHSSEEDDQLYAWCQKAFE